MAYKYPTGSGSAGSGSGGTITEADVSAALEHRLSTGHVNLTHSDGSLAYDTGTMLHNMAKPTNDGTGAVYGTGMGHTFITVGDGSKLFVAYADGSRGLQAGPAPTVDSPELTIFTALAIPFGSHKLIFGSGAQAGTGYGGIGMRKVFKRAGTENVIATTCDDNIWESSVPSDGHGYGGIVNTIADAYNNCTMAVTWPVGEGTLVDVVYEFKAPVVLKGTGTWGTTWAPAWQDDRTPITMAEAVYYDVWAAKTYAVNDKIVEDGVIYRANTAGAQVGSFAANTALWTEVGNIPSVMIYKGGISVANFNAITTGSAGDFYRISDTGTLTGGQAAIVGDQVVVNTAVSVTIAAGQFDYFPNQETSTIVPPWTAKTYALDDAIYDGTTIWYCSSAGAQVTDFATNAASWKSIPRVESNVKVDTDAAYNLGASAKGFNKIFIKGGVHYNDNGLSRIGFTATETDVYSPDGNDNIRIENNAIRLMTNNTSKVLITSTETAVKSPDALSNVTVTNTDVTADVNSIERIKLDNTYSYLKSPDGTDQLIVGNNDIRLQVNSASKMMMDVDNVTFNVPLKMGGSTAPGLKTKILDDLTGSTQGGSVSIAHGLTLADIRSFSVLVTQGGNRWPPGSTIITKKQYDVWANADSIVVQNHANNSADVLNKVVKVLVTYEP